MLASDISERIARLEANEKSIYHKLDETRDEIRELRRLATAVEKLATCQSNMNEKLDSIDNRLGCVERSPAEDFKTYKRLIAGCLISTPVAAMLGALLAIVLN